MTRERETNEVELLEAIRRDPRYVANLDWGQPRAGHPEGTVRAHIEELERNLTALEDRLTERVAARIRVLIHVHDSFKAEAKSGVAIEDPRSHASLARSFLAEFTDDADLLAITQWHDVPYALWRKARHTRKVDEPRFRRLLKAIDDWETFVPFLIVDNRTVGKRSEPLDWFLDLLEDRGEHVAIVHSVV